MVDAVRSRRAFAALRRSRSRARSGPLWVVRTDAPPTDESPPAARPQVAYAIGKAVGGAVVRNRVRRRLRALVDEMDRAGALTPGLYLIGADAAAVETPYQALRQHLDGALAGVR